MAQAEGVVSRVEEELFRLRELLKANPELLQFLKDPNVKPEGKRQALGDLFQGRVHPLVLSTLISLSDQDRAGRVLHVIEDFSTIAAAARQTITGEVTVVVTLDDATLGRMATELSRIAARTSNFSRKSTRPSSAARSSPSANKSSTAACVASSISLKTN